MPLTSEAFGDNSEAHRCQIETENYVRSGITAKPHEICDIIAGILKFGRRKPLVNSLFTGAIQFSSNPKET